MLLLFVGALRGVVAEEAEAFLRAIRRTGDVAEFVSPIADPPPRPSEALAAG